MLIGTKLQHVVSTLALEIREQTGPSDGHQVKPRDDLFWFNKPEILLWLIQFVIFQVKVCSNLKIHILGFSGYSTHLCLVLIFFCVHCRMPLKWQHIYGPWLVEILQEGVLCFSLLGLICFITPPMINFFFLNFCVRSGGSKNDHAS